MFDVSSQGFERLGASKPGAEERVSDKDTWSAVIGEGVDIRKAPGQARNVVRPRAGLKCGPPTEGVFVPLAEGKRGGPVLA